MSVTVGYPRPAGSHSDAAASRARSRTAVTSSRPAELHRGRRGRGRGRGDARRAADRELADRPDRRDARPALRRAALDRSRGDAADRALPARRCPGAGLETRDDAALAPGRVRPVPRPACSRSTCSASRPRRPPTRRARSPTPATRRRLAIASAEAARAYGLEVIADDVGDHPARSRASSRSRRTRASAGGEGWRTALSFVTDHQPGALFRALGAARAQRRQPRAARLAPASELAVALPLRRRARRSRVRSVGAARARRDARDRRASCGSSARYAAGGRAVSGTTLFRKIWDAHVVDERRRRAGAALRRPAPRARGDERRRRSRGCGVAGRPVRRPDLTVATMDHNVPTLAGPITDPLAKRAARRARARTATEFGVPLFATGSGREGIVHVIGPELGLTQPGMTIVCGDSHTSTHGAFGALAFGIGTSEVEHVLATQTLPQARPKTMQVALRRRRCRSALTAKDMVLARDRPARRRRRRRATCSSTPGAAIEALSMEGRMTVCNMSIEAGARAGHDRARRRRRSRTSKAGRPRRRRRLGARARAVALAAHRPRRRASTRSSQIDVSQLTPQVTWGTNPGMVAPVDGVVPDPADYDDPTSARRSSARCATWTSTPGTPLARDPHRPGLHRLVHERAHRGPARGGAGRRPAGASPTACARSSCPGSAQVKRQAEAGGAATASSSGRLRVAARGLLDVPRHEPGHPRSPASAARRRRTATSRDGRARAARTHLVSPAMAAAAAISGPLHGRAGSSA